MKNDIRKNPPHWCKDAIPSARGWCDPKTGELLISVKGIQFEVKEPVQEVKIKPENVVIETPRVEETPAPNVEAKEEAPKKRGGRKKKTEQ